MKRPWLALVLFALGLGMPGIALAQAAPKPGSDEDLKLQAMIEVVRSDIRAKRVAMINNAMKFNDAEMKAFWPVYREFETKQMALNDERLKLIKSYADSVATITDKAADAMALRALELESKRTALKQEHYKKLKAVLPVKRAVQAIALEQQISLMVDLEIAADVNARPLK
jgi:hypothetical protein